MGFSVNEEPMENCPEEVFSFHSNCPSCGTGIETRMHLVEIPHFREVIIMATSCDHCGYRTNEVKAGGSIAEKGKRITLKVTCVEDLNRDVLKSESCTLMIPEIDLHLTTGSLGGRFTTLEGLISQIRHEIMEKVPFALGDSAVSERKSRFEGLLSELQQVISFLSFANIIRLLMESASVR